LPVKPVVDGVVFCCDGGGTARPKVTPNKHDTNTKTTAIEQCLVVNVALTTARCRRRMRSSTRRAVASTERERVYVFDDVIADTSHKLRRLLIILNTTASRYVTVRFVTSRHVTSRYVTMATISALSLVIRVSSYTNRLLGGQSFIGRMSSSSSLSQIAAAVIRRWLTVDERRRASPFLSWHSTELSIGLAAAASCPAVCYTRRSSTVVRTPLVSVTAASRGGRNYGSQPRVLFRNRSTLGAAV